MSLFKPFEPNPFRVNAFTLTGVGVDVVGTGDIEAIVQSRAEEIEDQRSPSIVLVGGERHAITVADLTQNKEVLRDPNRRHREELLATRDYRFDEVHEIAEFRASHALTQGSVQRFLSTAPLDVTGLLIRGLPEPEINDVAVPNEPVPALPAVPVRCAPAAMLVRSRDRHA